MLKGIFADVQRVLVFGAHGDDEIIGCGGTVSSFAKQGVEITVVTFTRRETSYARIEEKERAAANADAEMAVANDILGVAYREVLGLPNQGVENNRANFQLCTKLIRKYRPDIIFTHSPHDHHRDHRAVSQLVDEARWKASGNLSPDWGEPWETKWVFHYEIFDLIEKPYLIFSFNEDHLRNKIGAMKSQVSQLDVLGEIIRHIKGLAMVRGAAVRAKWGEAFGISNFHPAHL